MSTDSDVSGAVPGVNEARHVWLLGGYRAGEHSQVLALGEALGWPFEVKRLRHRPWEFLSTALRRAAISGIDRRGSDPLSPPWPDLVISAGARNESVCRWIRTQSDRTRIVHIGRPWAAPEAFDLVVTTPQYRLQEHPRVLQNALTLHRVTAARLDEAAARWVDRLSDLPTPRIAVLVGGNSGPYTFGPKAALRLGRQVSRLAERRGGSLLISTSFRTTVAASRALEENLTVPAVVHHWSKKESDNPYYGFLALASEIVVTGDSVAMLSEASATAKPVYIFDLGDGPDSMRELARRSGHHLDPVPFCRPGIDCRPGAWWYWQMMRLGPARLTRDLSLVHKGMIATGRAVWLGEEPPSGKVLLPPGDLQHTVQRVRRLFEEPRS